MEVERSTFEVAVVYLEITTFHFENEVDYINVYPEKISIAVIVREVIFFRRAFNLKTKLNLIRMCLTEIFGQKSVSICRRHNEINNL